MSLIQTKTAEELELVAKELLQLCESTKTEQAKVIALKGDLGAGKTTLVQHLSRCLGVEETVVSPTYVVMKRYELPTDMFGYNTLLHIDAYRIEDIDEMRVLQFSELLKEKDTIICIEWPERIAELIPEDAIEVSIEIEEPGRRITIN